VASTLATVAGQLTPSERQSICVNAAQILAHELPSQANERRAWVGTLVELSARLKPTDAARICGHAARLLASAMALKKDPLDDRSFSTDSASLATISARLEPAESARVWGEVVQSLITALARQKDPRDLMNFGYSEMWPGLERAEAARLCSHAAPGLLDALKRENDIVLRDNLAGSLGSIADGLDSVQAEVVCSKALQLVLPSLERMRSTDSFGGMSPSATWVTPLASRMDPAVAASLLATAIGRAENATALHELVAGFVCVADHLEAGKAETMCRAVARALITDLGRVGSGNDRTAMGADLLSVVGRPDKTEAAKLCAYATGLLATALERETDSTTLASLAYALATASARLDPPDARRATGHAARSLAAALLRENNDSARGALAHILVRLPSLTKHSVEGADNALATVLIMESDGDIAKRLASLAVRSDPAEAARIHVEAARILASAFEREKDNGRRDDVRDGLASLSGCLDPSEAAKIFGHAARLLGDSLTLNSSHQHDWTTAYRAVVLQSSDKLAQLLSSAASRLDDAEVNRACDRLLGSLKRESFDSITLELLPHLNPGKAHALAWDLASRMCSGRQLDAEILSRSLTDNGRDQRDRRAVRMAAAGPGLEAAVEAAVRVSAEPFPCRLTTQELVELLKMPTCFGKARRIVLDQLGNRYGRRFVNHWAFVRFATERKLGLDFTTPPKQPDRREQLERPL
jgi:hypothetical protein